MALRSIKFADIKNKKVLLRVDFNVPVNKNGEIEENTRIVEALPTIEYILKNEAILILLTHFGRPEGKIEESLRVNKIGEELERLLGKKVHKFDDIIGPKVEEVLKKAKNGEIYLLENLRFDQGEEANDPEFVKKLAALGDIYVNDAFGTAHRKHSSTFGLAEVLPAYAGFLLEKEVTILDKMLKNPEKPVALILGGAKISTKVPIIQNLISKVDYILIGGGIANTFLAAAGYNVAASLCEKDKITLCQEIMLQAEKNQDKFILPKDVVVASEIGNEVETLDIPIEDTEGDMKILDIGKKSAEHFAKIIYECKTVIWNGPLGLYEYKPFQQGSKIVAEAIIKSKAESIIGGGDSIDCIKKLELDLNKFSHVSTGGGAMLEFLGGIPLPGVEILRQK